MSLSSGALREKTYVVSGKSENPIYRIPEGVFAGILSITLRSGFPLHGGLLYHAHDGPLRRGVGDGVSPAVTDDEQRCAGALVVVSRREQVDVGHEFDRSRGPHGGSSDGHAQLERPSLLDGEEYPE